ncbi:MAG TPA: hypothetical protein VE782_04935, partial [Myxococcaceae bacterium]|nr:hypothetical protein [Myxococcaceae bacterium]
PMAAHFALEHSPGHRRSLLEPRFDRVGIGVSWQKASDGPRVVVTEVLVSSPRQVQVTVNSAELPGPTQVAMSVPDAPPDSDPVAAMYERIAAGRSARKLPSVRRSEALEAIARAHAEANESDPALAIHDRVFAAAAGEGAPVLASVPPSQVELLPLLRDSAIASVGIAVVVSGRRGNVERFIVVAAPAP